MKQHIFKQTLLAKSLAFFFVAVMVIIAACNKESFYTKSIDNNVSAEQKSSDAQKWFEGQQTISTSTYLKTMKPNWNIAITVGGVVHVPIQFDSGKHHIPSLYKGTAYLGREKLVIYEKNGKYNGFVADFMPSKEFKGNIDFLNILNSKEQKFDGSIVLKNLDGEYAHAIQFKDGQVTKRLVNRAVIPLDNAPEALECLIYYQWRCYQTPNCCCIECQLVEKSVCWTVSANGDAECPSPAPSCSSDGCPGPFSWCDDQGGTGGGGSADMLWIRNSQLGAVETILVSNVTLFDAVKRFLDNTGDYTLYRQVVIDALLNVSNKRVLVSFFNYLTDYPAYLAALQQANWPVIGSQEWAQITDDNIDPPPANVTFEGFSSQELGGFLVIPENIRTTALYVPSNSTEGDVDGFFARGWTNQQYWFKISGGGRATVRKTNTGFDIVNIFEDPFWRFLAQLRGTFYCTCWQDINQPRPADNPLPR